MRLREAEKLGALLALGVMHGMPTVQAAVIALRRGEATPAQQKIVAKLLDAITEGES